MRPIPAALRAAPLLALVLAVPAAAAETPAPRPLPPAAAVCANCHGPDGRLHGPIPAIAGRPAAFIAQKLRAYRDGADKEATVMPRLARGLTEAEIDSVAVYFSQVR